MTNISDVAGEVHSPGIAIGSLSRIIRTVSRVCYYFGALLLIIIMFLVTIDCSGRFLFNRPIPGTLEITEFLLAGAVLLGLAHTQHLGANVMVELFYNRLSPRAQNIQRVLSHTVGAVLFALVTWNSAIYAMDGFSNNLVSDILQIPAWPFLFFAPIGCALLTLEFTIQALEGICELRQKQEKE